MQGKLLALVRACGMQQSELATAAGCSTSTISRKLAGLCKLDDNTARAVLACCRERVAKAAALLKDDELKTLND